jgi:DNA polymerase-3 subunit delta'
MGEDGVTWGIIGHEWAVALLHHGLSTGRVAHAYLFSGPPNIGKTRLAQALAQALVCREPDRPCGRCASCQKVAQQAHPDVRLIVGEGAGDSIKIDQIRALRREAVLSPYEAQYRVYILRRVDLASAEAANSLLKILEEPPGHVILALTAVRVELLPATVVSRCQRVDLRPVASGIVEAALLDRGLAAPQAELLARLSGGRVGWALQASQDDGMLSRRRQDLDRFVELLSAGSVERLDFAWKASRDPDTSRRLIELWMGWCRDLLLVCSGTEDRVLNVDRGDELGRLAEQTTILEAWAALGALQVTAARLEANVNARLALEGLFLTLPRWRSEGGPNH